jgi:hypothetical protein
MTPPAVQVTVHDEPADPVRLAAWHWLWRRLLAPEQDNAPEAATAEASEDGTAVGPCRNRDGDAHDHTRD